MLAISTRFLLWYLFATLSTSRIFRTLTPDATVFHLPTCVVLSIGRIFEVYLVHYRSLWASFA